jgi:hypothetical protein
MRKIILLLLSVTSILSVQAQFPTAVLPNVLVNGGTVASPAAIASTASSNFKLSIQGNILQWGTGVNTATSPTIYFRNTTATTGRVWAINSDNTGIFTISDAAGTPPTLLTHTSRFIINATGNMGVGTISNPTTFTSLINLGSTAANSKLAVWDNGTIKSGFGWATGQLRMHLSATTDKFSFLGTETATADLVTILGTGNVGVGVAAPAQKLDVAGSIQQSAVVNSLLKTDATGKLIPVLSTDFKTINTTNNLLGTGNLTLEVPLTFSTGLTRTSNNVGMTNMNANTIKGVLTAGAPIDLTATQATSILDVFTTTTKGLVPSPGGTSNTTDFLRRDGNWAAPPGGAASQWTTVANGISYNANNVGVGVAIPEAKLDIRGSYSNPGINGFNSTGNLLNVYSTNASGAGVGGVVAFGGNTGLPTATFPFAFIQGSQQTVGEYGGMLSFWTTSNGSANGETNSANYQRMVINKIGNIGIGTTAPATKLDVNGAITTNGGLLMKSGALIQMWNSTNGNYGQISSFDGGGFKMSTGALKEVNILNNGNVGIGVAAPTSLLHLPLSGNIAIGTPDVNNTEGAALSSNELRFRTNANYYTSLATVPGAYELQVLDKNNSTLGGIKANIAKVNSIYSTNNFVVANVLDGQLKVGGQAYGGIPFYVKENSGTTDVYPSMIIEGGKSTAAATYVPLSLHLKPSINIDNVTTGISFGGNNIGGVDNSNSSQAGIYVRSSNVQGTTMKFATTNAYANGAQMRMTIDPTGNVGIGTETPTSNAKLDIVGKIKITDGSQGVNKVLTSDASGLASWADIPVTVATTTAWGLLGNTNATASSFLGTALNTDFDLIFKRNGVLSGKLNSALALTTFGVSAGLANTTGINNTFLGTASGATNTTGEKNTGLGVQSLLSNISGNNNTAIGVNTLRSNTSGSRNLAIGYDALYGNTTGTDNIAIGLSAGSSITSGIKNIILGSPSATSPTNLTQGSYNTIIGSDITGISPTLSNNIILADGQGNRRINVNELGNVGIGTITPNYLLHVNGEVFVPNKIGAFKAGFYSSITETDGGYALVQGNNIKASTINTNKLVKATSSQTAQYINMRYDRGIYFGTGVGAGDIAGTEYADDVNTRMVIELDGRVGIGTTTPLGILDVQSTTKGVVFPRMSTVQKLAIVSPVEGLEVYDLTLKQKSFYNGTTWVQSLSAAAIGGTGWLTGGNADATATSFLGTPTGTDVDLVFKRNGVLSGKINSSVNLTTFGVNSGSANTTGLGNTFLGSQSGYSNTTSSYNSFVGYGAGSLNTGALNTFIGALSGNLNTAGGSNTFIGYYAGGANTTGNSNNFLGQQAGFSNTTGGYNNFIGHIAGAGNTIGVNNNFLGFNAGASNTAGNNNMAIGGSTLADATTATASNNTAIGSNTGRGIITGGNNTIVGANVIGLPAALSNNIILADGQGNRRINVNELGNVGIGVSTVPNNYKLAVAGAIIATKVTVKLQANWPDYVFNKNYELPSLQSVESFIKTNNHLPGVPSADKVKKEGIDLGDNQTILLKKVEELTLYIIDQDKKIVKLQAEKDELKNMQKQIDELKAMLLKK